MPVLNIAFSLPFQPTFAGLLQPEDAQCHLGSSFDGYLNYPPTSHPGVFADVKHKNNVMGQCETFQCCAWTNLPPVLATCSHLQSFMKRRPLERLPIRVALAEL
ncbi:hypothetical protein MTO96_018067 [Rhipicephalus appendiculatus]